MSEIIDDYFIVDEDQLSGLDKNNFNESKSDNGYVYTLKLEHGKYYVGHTKRKIPDNKHGEIDVNIRLMEHFNNNGAKWTLKYKPIKVLCVVPGSLSDEDRITLACMKEHGWWNVRGGKYSMVEMTKPPPELELGKIDHIKDTVVSAFNFFKHVFDIVSYENSKTKCKRCGRESHQTTKCYAKRHVDGSFIKSYTKCKRCGRTNHKTAGCYARTHINGKIIL